MTLDQRGSAVYMYIKNKKKLVCLNVTTLQKIYLKPVACITQGTGWSQNVLVLRA